MMNKAKTVKEYEEEFEDCKAATDYSIYLHSKLKDNDDYKKKRIFIEVSDCFVRLFQTEESKTDVEFVDDDMLGELLISKNNGGD